MNREYTALDLQCLNERRDCSTVWSEISVRDCLAVIVVVGLVAGWGFDRWRTARIQSTSSTALAEARTALENTRKEARRAMQQLRSEQETLVAQLVAEQEVKGKLRQEIAALEAKIRPDRIQPRYAAGRER